MVERFFGVGLIKTMLSMTGPEAGKRQSTTPSRTAGSISRL